jgi:hypothetical protein
MIEVPFASQVAGSDSPVNSQELLVNLYPEIETSNGKKKLLRIQRPGLAQTIDIDGEARGIARFSGVYYAVFGTKLYRLASASATHIGTLSSSTGPVTFAKNTTQVAVADGASMYVWDGTSTTTVSPPAGASRIGTLGFLNGRGIFDSGEGRFFATATEDFTSIDELDFATAESASDDIIRLFVDHREIWLFGPESIEVWYDQGGASFPFVRQTNVALERGCLAKNSVAANDNSIFWLGDDKVVYRAEAYRPVRISTHPVERLIKAVQTPENAEANFIEWSGHKWYHIRFPGELSLVYDVATGSWWQPRSWGSNDWTIRGNPKGADTYVVAPGGVFQLDEDALTDDGTLIERVAISPPIHADGERFNMYALWVDMDVGTAASGVAPKVMLDWSDDGRTWSNEHWRSAGLIGEYQRRVTWRNLGQSRSRTFRLRMTDNVRTKIIGAHANFKSVG